ncbi:formate/nitrite transporter family protein [Halobacterium sp. R2-5]|uniref:formate/nitrite transporter family protein n=1 Tax=Halobacterium sp. R2-5 TaxID=2715751 RepID=UPI00142374E3|nr:formate/nitrite transporter family protein [Halobacterium sp. R2-5]
MASAPDPAEIFDRSVDEGERRLTQSTGELAATSFIAGFTVVVGIAALGVTHAMVDGEVARIAGALAFAPALVFLVVGRTELFNENFFDPTAAAVDSDDGWLVRPLLRLWVFTFVFNFIGGALLAAFVAIEGALPAGSAEALATVGAEIAHREAHGVFGSAVLGGTIVAMLSFLLQAVDSSGSRIALSFMVGFLLALGPFDHVVVTGLHLLFGMLFGAAIGYGELVTTTAVSLAGNVVGGLGLVTVSHVEQVRGARDSEL